MGFSRVQYNFNDRGSILNDKTTNTDRFVLVGTFRGSDPQPVLETETITVEVDRPLSEGIIDFGSKLSGGVIKVPVIVYGKTMGHLNDMVDVLKQAFNPALTDDDATWGKGNLSFPGGDGFHPLKWTEELGSGTRNVRIFCKPLEIPPVNLDTLSGRARASEITLRIEDPRKYSQTLSELVGGGTASNSGNFRTPTKIVIAASGTTSTSLTIDNDTNGEQIAVTTALTAGQTLTIDTRHQSVDLNGTESRSIISTGSDWLHLEPGNNTISIANGTNATITTSWSSCWGI